MIAMAVQDEWVSVPKAAKIAGCSEQYIRRDLLEHLPRDEKEKPTSDRTTGGRLEGWLVNGRAWMVSVASAQALRETLSTRAAIHAPARAARKAGAAVQKRAKRPAAKRKKSR
jgi:hypothetical protein